jgi:hypothetical protein
LGVTAATNNFCFLLNAKHKNDKQRKAALSRTNLKWAVHDKQGLRKGFSKKNICKLCDLEQAA